MCTLKFWWGGVPIRLFRNLPHPCLAGVKRESLLTGTENGRANKRPASRHDVSGVLVAERRRAWPAARPAAGLLGGGSPCVWSVLSQTRPAKTTDQPTPREENKPAADVHAGFTWYSPSAVRCHLPSHLLKAAKQHRETSGLGSPDIHLFLNSLILILIVYTLSGHGHVNFHPVPNEATLSLSKQSRLGVRL